MPYARSADRRRADRLAYAQRKRRRTGLTTVSTTVSWGEKDEIQAAAKARGKTASALLRDALYALLDDDQAVAS
jgi:hypothetical protein